MMRYIVVVVYDISSSKFRRKMIKLLQKYGFRTQESVFEADLSKKQYQSLIHRLEWFVPEDEDVRVYRLESERNISVFGKAVKHSMYEETVVI